MGNKFRLFILVSLITILLSAPDRVVAADGNFGEGLHWECEDGLLTISGTGTMPDYDSDYTATPWYEYKSSITKIIIESGIQNVGNGAFYQYESLVSLVLPEGLKEIGNESFLGCNALEQIAFPEGLEIIGFDAFYNCTSLSNITFPSTLKTIKKEAFKYCTSLTDLVLPENLELVDNQAFGDLQLNSILIKSKKLHGNYIFDGSTIQRMEFDEGVTFLQGYQRTSYIGLLVIPTSVETFSYAPFECCGLIEQAIFKAKRMHPETGSYTGSTTDLTNGERFFGYSGLKSITLTSDVEWVYSDLCRDCSSLTEVDLQCPKAIGFRRAFSNCNSLERVIWTIENGIFAQYCFENCENLKEIVLADDVRKLPYNFASYSNSVEELTIPEGVTYLDAQTFYSMSGLKTVYFNPVKLEAVDVDSTQLTQWWGTTQSYNIFASCPNVEQFIIGDGVTVIPMGCLQYSAIKELVIPKSVQLIGAEAFAFNYGLKKVMWNAINCSQQEVEDKQLSYLFNNCAIEEATIGEKVEYLPAYLFAKCNNLCSLILNRKLKAIQWAYSNSSYLDYEVSGLLTDSASLTEINWTPEDCRFAKYAFNCSGIQVFTVADGVKYIPENLIITRPGILRKVNIGKDLVSYEPQTYTNWDKQTIVGTVLNWGAKECITQSPLFPLPEQDTPDATSYPIQIITLNLLDTVEKITAGVFKDTWTLTNVRVGRAVKEIDSTAFENTSALQSVIWDAIAAEAAFEIFRTSGLEELWIGEGVISLPDRLVANCLTLKNLTLPATLEEAGAYTFANTTDLKSVVWYPVACKTASHVFDGSGIQFLSVANKVCSLPDRLCENAGMLTEVQLNEGLTQVGGSLFKGTAVTELFWVPIACTEGSYALAECDIEHLVVVDGVLTLPDELGRGMQKLNSLVLPAALQQAGEYTFAQTPALVHLSWTPVNCDGRDIFYDSGLEVFTVVEGVLSLPKGICRKASHLREVKLNTALIRIGTNAFNQTVALNQIVWTPLNCMEANCIFVGSGIQTFTVADGVIGLPDRLCEGTTSLVEVRLNSDLRTIGSRVFASNPALKELCWMPVECSSIGEGASVFDGTSLTKFTISQGAKRIPSRLITAQKDLEFFHYLAEDLTMVSPQIFVDKDTGIQTLNIAASVKSLQEGIFSDLRVATVNYEADGSSGQSGAFRDVEIEKFNLTRAIRIPSDFIKSGKVNELIIADTVTVLENEAVPAKVDSLIADFSNVVYFGDRCLQNAMANTLILGGSAEYIGDSAFQSVTITNLTLPVSCKYLGNNAFQSSRLTSLKLGNNLVYLGSSFAVLDIPVLEINISTLKWVAPMAFCSDKLQELSIKGEGYQIARQAFSNATALKKVVLDGDLKAIADDNFTQQNGTDFWILDKSYNKNLDQIRKEDIGFSDVVLSEMQ